MPRIRDSKLFKSTAPFLPKGFTQRQYLKELALAKKICKEFHDDHEFGISSAFVWSESPQGHNFWSKLDDKIMEAKRHVNYH